MAVTEDQFEKMAADAAKAKEAKSKGAAQSPKADAPEVKAAPPQAPKADAPPVVIEGLQQPYKCLHEFNWPVNGQFLSFKSAQVLTDKTIIKMLLDGGAPIAPIGDYEKYTRCDRCTNVFIPVPLE